MINSPAILLRLRENAALPPSRNDNPFATCWTRPGALPFLFTDGTSAQQLIDQLEAHRWHGEIIGPHGSGKSTLLEALKPLIRAAGCELHPFSLSSGQRRLPRGWSLTAPAAHHDAVSYQRRIFIIDGYEQFSAWQRLRLKIRCRRRGSGLLVTSHTATGLPTLIQLAPDRRLVEDLVGHLCSNVSSGVTPADVAASHACHGTNVRDILFDLYDRHEHWRHKNRTPRLAGT